MAQESQVTLVRSCEANKAPNAKRRRYTSARDAEPIEITPLLKREKQKVKGLGETNATCNCRIKMRLTKKHENTYVACFKDCLLAVNSSTAHTGPTISCPDHVTSKLDIPSPQHRRKAPPLTL